ncbi:MAG TPA: HAD-IA family hydrolase [Vicinamibacterales bacterium]|nr:HAD-IA family hydrolase [Vicinamibacterales bacterium]
MLFDLFHTLVSVPVPALAGELPAAEHLGVCSLEWQRRYHDEDVFGRCVGRVTDAFEAMRLVAHSIDPAVPLARIHAAVESRRRCFAIGLVNVEPAILSALDRLRAAGIRTALVSDAGADDVESWPRSPLRERFDAVVFSYAVGVRKPDRTMYQRALDGVGVTATDAIFVGDGGSEEHQGARALGLKTVLVTRLLSYYRAGVVDARRADADWEFADVPAFVDALDL